MSATVNPAPAPAPASSLAEQACAVLRDRLVTLEIRPGAPLNDEALGREFHVGRTPIREAFKRLETERLVVAYPRRGTFATDVQITDLAHICEVRQALEPLAASTAAARRLDSDRAALEALVLARLRRPPTGVKALIRHDMAVHRAIYRATHNPHLEDTLTRYDNLATRIWCLFADRLADLAGHVEEHDPLISAVLAGNSRLAGKLAAQHVARFEKAIRAVI